MKVSLFRIFPIMQLISSVLPPALLEDNSLSWQIRAEFCRVLDIMMLVDHWILSVSVFYLC